MADSRRSGPSTDQTTLKAWQQTGRRRRILEGDEWRQDLHDYMGRHVGAKSLISWGEPSIAVNLLKSIVGKVATLYRLEPIAENDGITEEAAEYMQGLGIFSRHRRLNRLTVGLRECLVRVRWSPSTAIQQARPEIELVTPDCVEMDADAAAPGRPYRIAHAVRLRDPVRRDMRWFWEEWDLRDPTAPRFRILDSEKRINGERQDRTREFDRDPLQYEWVDPATGLPYMPWVLYHAEDTGALRDPDGWSEIVDGTYTLGMLATFWLHIVRNASWSQAYGINVHVRGTVAKGEGGENVRQVATDPKSILMFDGDDGGTVGTIDKPAEPEYVIAAIMQYAGWLLSQIGLGAEDAQVQASQSGIALTIRKEGVIALQQQFLPEFRRGDLDLLSIVAKTCNAMSAGDPSVPALPTEGWDISYPAAPKRRDEVVERLDSLLSQVEAGLLSKVDVYLQMNPGRTREQALDDLIQIARENLLLSVPLAPDPTPDPQEEE